MILPSRLFLSSMLLLLSAQASFGITVDLTSGGTDFDFNDNTGQNLNVNSNASFEIGGVDQLFEYGFYFVSGGTATRLSDGTFLGSAGAPPNATSIGYTPVTGLNIDISYDLGSTPNPNLGIDIDIVNTTGGTIDGSLVFYFDYDLNNQTVGHLASVNGAGDEITLTQGGTQATITGNGADAFQILEFFASPPTFNSPLRDLIEAGTRLNNTNALSSTTGDFTGAFQFDFNLAGGEQEVIETDVVIVVPEASHYGILVGAFAFLFIARRRK